MVRRLCGREGVSRGKFATSGNKTRVAPCPLDDDQAGGRSWYGAVSGPGGPADGLLMLSRASPRPSPRRPPVGS